MSSINSNRPNFILGTPNFILGTIERIQHLDDHFDNNTISNVEQLVKFMEMAKKDPNYNRYCYLGDVARQVTYLKDAMEEPNIQKDKIESKLKKLKNSVIWIANRKLKISSLPDNSLDQSLVLSIHAGDQATISKLLKENKIDVNKYVISSKGSCSLLWIACCSDNIETVEFFLSKLKAEPNFTFEGKQTILGQIVTKFLDGTIQDCENILQALYDHGATFDPIDVAFQRSLFQSLTLENKDRSFLKFRCILRALRKLDQAKASVFVNLYMSKQLQEFDPDVYQKQYLGYSLLEYACDQVNVANNKKDKEKWIEVITFLIRRGAAITELDWLKLTLQLAKSTLEDVCFSIGAFEKNMRQLVGQPPSTDNYAQVIELDKVAEMGEEIGKKLAEESNKGMLTIEKNINNIKKYISEIEEEISEEEALIKEKANELNNQISKLQALSDSLVFNKKIKTLEEIHKYVKEIQKHITEMRYELKLQARGDISKRLKLLCQHQPKIMKLLENDLIETPNFYM